MIGNKILHRDLKILKRIGKCKCTNWKGIKRLALNYISFAVAATIKSIFINKEFDVILVYQLSPITMALPGILLKKLTQKPLVIHCYDLWRESITCAGISADSKIYSLLIKLSKWIYKNAWEN